MKKRLHHLTGIVLTCLVIVTSCNKNHSETAVDSTSQVTVETDDQSRMFEETDAISNDANFSLEASTSFSVGR